MCSIEGCGARAERHHKDGNTKNNAPENIEFLCHRHHTITDGRAAALVVAAARANTGRKMATRSESHRAALSAAMTGKSQPEETRAKLRAANLGKKYGPRSEETRRKISEAKKAGFRRRLAQKGDS